MLAEMEACEDFNLNFTTTTEDESSNDIDMYDILGDENLGAGLNPGVDQFPNVHGSCATFDPNLYTSKTYFSFDEKTFQLMVEDLAGAIEVSLAILKAHDVRGLMDLKKWKRTKEDLFLYEAPGSQRRYLCLKSTGLKLTYIEDWEHIIHVAHCASNYEDHLGLAATISRIKGEWCTDQRKHGIPLEYIKDMVIACGCMTNERSIEHDVSSWPLRSQPTDAPSISIVTTMSRAEEQLIEIMIKHQTRLVLVRSTKKHGAAKWLQEYMCHRGGNIERRGTNKRRQRKSKRCGCPFKVVVQHFQEVDKVIIKVSYTHEGHIPGSRADLYHLPVHPSVVACCMEDLFDVGTCRHVAKMSKSKESLHMKTASALDRTIYRFFMIPKEVQMLLHQMRMEGGFAKHEWSAVLAECYRLQDLKKVIFVQPYNPKADDEERKPFVLIIQDQWMLEMAIRFSRHNSWAVDSTFKTNVFGLPLYAAVLPNQNGVGIPIWLMLCTNDTGTNQEKVALQLTFKIIFAKLGEVRPTAIVIDKSAQELEAILRVVNEDPYCWKIDEEGRREQVAGHVLLCWFHVKKAWVENLLPQVPKDKRDDVYNRLSNLMHAATEEIFDLKYRELLHTYSAHDNIQRYVSNGWCGSTCMWRRRWPKFGRLFAHGNVDTTNLVERLWQYIKYTLLDAKVNRSLLVLLHALVGNSLHGTHIGGTLLEFFKQKQEIADSGRFNRFGSSQKHTSRLAAGEAILHRFEADHGTLQVIEESTLLFKLLSMSSASQWYHISIQSNYCDCPDWGSECKHLYGIRLIIEKHFSHLLAIFPILDRIHALSNVNLPCNSGAREQETLSLLPDMADESISKIDTQIGDCISDLKKLLEGLEEQLGQCDDKLKPVILNQLRLSRNSLSNFIVPKKIDLPARGSIRQVQAHVMQTRLGHGVAQENAGHGADLRVISAPPLKPSTTGVLKRKHQRGRSRVQFQRKSRIFCPHCCSKTLLLDPLESHSCHTCHALLPLSSKQVPIGSEAPLLNRYVTLYRESIQIGLLMSCGYGSLETEERSFTIHLLDGSVLEKILASQIRMMLYT